MPFKYVPDPILEPYKDVLEKGVQEHKIGTWLQIRDFMAENAIAYDFATKPEDFAVVSETLETFALASYKIGFQQAVKLLSTKKA